MSISHYIKEIGRGKEGARSLSQSQAHDLMSQVLDGQVSDMEIGAFALAMRIKSESIEELSGFLLAANERCIALQAPAPAVVLPSYNGARKLPNLTPLLALLLAQEGVPVLVHGMPEDPTRVTSADIFRALGLPDIHDAAEAAKAWARREPVFLQTDRLCPPLATLLNARWVIGLRNSGHTVAKLLNPFGEAQALRVVNYTHPEYAQMLSEFLPHTQASAMLMRGTEGEPVADARRAPKLEVFLRGERQAPLSLTAQDGVLRDLPVLPREHDATTTAVYIQAVLSGEKPVPGPIAQQVALLVQALGRLRDAPSNADSTPASRAPHRPAQ